MSFTSTGDYVIPTVASPSPSPSLSPSPSPSSSPLPPPTPVLQATSLALDNLHLFVAALLLRGGGDQAPTVAISAVDPGSGNTIWAQSLGAAGVAYDPASLVIASLSPSAVWVSAAPAASALPDALPLVALLSPVDGSVTTPQGLNISVLRCGLFSAPLVVCAGAGAVATVHDTSVAAPWPPLWTNLLTPLLIMPGSGGGGGGSGALVGRRLDPGAAVLGAWDLSHGNALWALTLPNASVGDAMLPPFLAADASSGLLWVSYLGYSVDGIFAVLVAVYNTSAVSGGAPALLAPPLAIPSMQALSPGSLALGGRPSGGGGSIGSGGGSGGRSASGGNAAPTALALLTYSDGSANYVETLQLVPKGGSGGGGFSLSVAARLFNASLPSTLSAIPGPRDGQLVYGATVAGMPSLVVYG